MIQKKKKICLVVSSTSIVNEFLLNHIKGLSDFFDIYLVVNVKSGSPIESDLIVEIFDLPIERRPHFIKDLICLVSLNAYFKKKKFDIVHTITPKGGLIGMLCSYFAGVPFRVHIFTGQVWYTKSGITKYLLKLSDKIIAKFATHLLVDGISQQQFLLEQGIVTLKNSRVLGAGSISGVNRKQFELDPKTRKQYRAKYAIEDADIVFAYMGRLNRDKGILDLVHAFNSINYNHSNIKLALIGMDEEELIPSIQKSFDCKNILFIKYTREPFNILQLADIFCFPSYREGFGMSVIEASMLALPVICSDTYGLNETIIPGVTGLKHRVGDIFDLENKMETLLKNKELRMLMGEKGKDYVMANFDGEHITKLWIDYYNTILNEKI